MIFDGLYVLKNGKYFGPEIPGPWSKAVSAVGIDPFSIGPIFVLLGVFWIVSALCLLGSLSFAWAALLFAALATLWYIKIGTAISVIVILILLLFKSSMGYA